MCGVISTGFPHLTADSFESSLGSDETLLHFFNEFLSLPSFPESLVFNQRSGLFEVVGGAAGVVSSGSLLLTDDPTAPGTSSKCLDREEGMRWIKRERLPFFFDSDCYHEYRLSKVLLHRDPNLYLNRGKRTSYRDTRSARLSQFDQNAQRTEKDSFLEENLRESRWQMFESLDQQLECMAAKVVKEVLENVEKLMDERSSANTSAHQTNCPGADKSSEDNICRHSADKDGERLPGEKERVQGGKRGSEGEEQPEWGWKNREWGSRGTQQEKGLDHCSTWVCCQATGPGLDGFREFLRGKEGEKVLNVWMDMERLKATRHKERKYRHLDLMRIWYLMGSSPFCLNEVVLSTLGLSTSPCWTEEKLQSAQSYFNGALLSYWAPRYLTSPCVQESVADRLPLGSTASCHGSSAPPVLRPAGEDPPPAGRIQARTPEVLFNKLQFVEDEDLLRRTEEMLQALCAESRSGFYFTHFCEQSGNQLWVNAVYCWTDLQFYKKWFYPDGPNPYRVQLEAQFLLDTYISSSARRCVGVDEEVIEEVHDQRMSPSEETFDRVEKRVLQILLEPWTLLVNRDRHIQQSLAAVCVQEEVRHIDSQESRGVQSLDEESERQLKQQSSSSSMTPPSSSSTTRILSESWSRVAPEYQEYRLDSLLRHRYEIDQFMSFLQKQDACIHLRCWLDLEQYRRTSEGDEEVRLKRSRHIVTKYLHKKYFFRPDGPVTTQQKNNILQMTGGLERLKSDCLSNPAAAEIQDIVRTRIERTWLPLFLSTPEFTERQKRKAENPDGGSQLAHRRRRARREARKTEGLWMSSSREIMQFRRVLRNPVTCQLFQLFVSTEGDFLENDLRFWLEVQKYKDICHSHSDEATVQKKISTIVSCFINSSVPPALQIDIPPEQAQNILDNRDELGPYVFREAQTSVFRELLKRWPEFQGFINGVEEKQLLPLLQQKREKHRARVRRRRRKEEDASRAQRELESRDSSGREEEDTDSDEETDEGQDGGSERKQWRKVNRLSFSYSKYMAGLMKEELMLRKESPTFSDSSCSLRSLQRCSRSTADGGRRAKRPAQEE